MPWILSWGFYQTDINGRLDTTSNVDGKAASPVWPWLEGSMADPAIEMTMLQVVRDIASYADDPSCNKKGFEVGGSQFGNCTRRQLG